MKRRNAIIGLGGIVAGSGALVGTGAFTSVQANRSVSVQTAGDASAALQIQPTTQAEEYITNDSSTGALTLDFGSGTKTGINMNAKTVISPLLAITNNSSTGRTTVKITSGSGTQTGESGNNGEAYDVIGYAISKSPRAVLTFFIGQPEPPTLQDSYNPVSDNGYVDGRSVNNRNQGGIEVEDGNSVDIGVIIDTRDLISDSSKDVPAYDESLTIVAGE
jgi:hypothetical protein